MNNSDLTTSMSDLKRQRTEPKSYAFGRKYERNRAKKAKQETTPDEEPKNEEGMFILLDFIQITSVFS